MEADELDQAFVQGLSTHGPVFTDGIPSLPGKAELMASLPPKPAADKFVNKFFDPADPAPPLRTNLLLTKAPTFHKQYDEHWRNPNRINAAWLGLLFSMLWMTVQSEIESPNDAAQYFGVGEDLADLYRTRTAQCLMHTSITRSELHVIETMCFQALAEYMRRKDIEPGIWMALGQVVRAAMRMGFRRDPSHYPKAFTPFQAEMRRRIWAFIRQADHFCSFHIGLPSMISSTISDTEMPSNLHDLELTKLPPSRSMSELTGITYMLDQELFQVVRDIPEPFRMTSREAAETEPPFKTMQRVHVGILHSEGTCALHRKYISSARKDRKFALSRQRCIQSAIALIGLQAGLHSLFRPGHRLEQSRWCLEPTVCLDLQQGGDGQSDSIKADDVLIGINRVERMRKVETAWDTWINFGDTTEEGLKFHRVFALVLQKLRSERDGGPSGNVPLQIASDSLDYSPPQTIPSNMGSGVASSAAAYTSSVEGQISLSNYTTFTPHTVVAQELVTDIPDINNWETLFQEYGFGNQSLAYLPDVNSFY
ncbi:hypothetical protein ACJ73_02584 [Blastomyces percursus]|uniref:Xylanolytic transcriptional activator regulatory domain-containing protein n=1 Tax=Blastomyces percursus TaxID=1658174 RepID=A0A1J9QC74_9EURO|nr:hypothetical protein ACJ73_02584 [Blastomyces percursus]